MKIFNRIIFLFLIVFSASVFSACNFNEFLLPVIGTGENIPKLITPITNSNNLEKNNYISNWQFDWSDVKNAQSYHIIVYNIESNTILVNNYNLNRSEYETTPIIRFNSKNQRKLVWSVRAKINGEWGNWAPYETIQLN